MTSVRPKLKPDQPKAVTAWDTATGKVVWMADDGSWSDDPARIGVFIGAESGRSSLATIYRLSQIRC